ncbi:MAG: type II secretion system protein [Lachnospiraceae bacterium]|nr:type II secretion system protein [Lachnospiraceae bacterium]
MQHFFRKENRGFSLIELIVVVLIIAILSTGVVMSLSAVYYSDTERAAKKFITYMSVARQYAMDENTEDGTTVVINLKMYRGEDGNYYIGVYRNNTLIYPETGDSEPELLCKYRVDIYGGGRDSDSPGKSKKLIDSEDYGIRHPLEYTFRKSSGQIKKAGKSENEETNPSEYFLDLYFEGAQTCKVYIAPAIGRCFLED